MDSSLRAFAESLLSWEQAANLRCVGYLEVSTEGPMLSKEAGKILAKDLGKLARVYLAMSEPALGDNMEDRITRNAIAVFDELGREDCIELIRYIISEVQLGLATLPAAEEAIEQERSSQFTKVDVSPLSSGQEGGSHYQAQTTPWDLQATMKSSGNVLADCRRADVIKYVWRIKGDTAKLIEDLKKAAHCIDIAIKSLSATLSSPE